MVFKALLFITDILIFGYQPEGRHVHKGEFQLTHNIETRLCRLRLTFQIKQSICILLFLYIWCRFHCYAMEGFIGPH